MHDTTLCAMGWMQRLTKFLTGVSYIVFAVKQQPMVRISGITLPMKHCLSVCLTLKRIWKKLNVAHAGVTTSDEACKDNPGCSCKAGLYTNTTNSVNPQTDSGGDHSTCGVYSNTSQQTGESGQSTSFQAERRECLDLTQENIYLEQENDTVLKHLLQWRKQGQRPIWAEVAPFGQEVKVMRKQ